MISKRVYVLVSLATAFLGSARGNTYQIILHGKVVMEDGSVPPVILGIERICSDNSGSAPGPITNKKGEFIWKMEIDPLETRDCHIRATHAGYQSTSVEVSGLDTTKTALELPPIIAIASVADANSIIVPENVPGKSKKDFEAALKALDASNTAEALDHMTAVIMASPKFAPGWHDLGILNGRVKKMPEARAAFEHAIEVDPKLLQSYVMLLRTSIKTMDWASAVKDADALMKADLKHSYPEVYLHLAVAKYGLKDYAAAEQNAQEAIQQDPAHKRPRSEYVLGRILEAKGDLKGAQEHMAKYLGLEPYPADVELVKGHLEHIGKPEAADVDPPLEGQ
jgi:Tfp pilus assembly protein PilF